MLFFPPPRHFWLLLNLMTETSNLQTRLSTVKKRGGEGGDRVGSGEKAAVREWKKGKKSKT